MSDERKEIDLVILLFDDDPMTILNVIDINHAEGFLSLCGKDGFLAKINEKTIRAVYEANLYSEVKNMKFVVKGKKNEELHG